MRYTADMNDIMNNPFRTIIDRCRVAANVPDDVADDEEALLGFFQGYRPARTLPGQPANPTQNKRLSGPNEILGTTQNSGADQNPGKDQKPGPDHSASITTLGPTGLESLFDGIPDPAGSLSLGDRLQRLFAAASEDIRPSGGRDAYFIVRRPPTIDPEHAESLAAQWLTSLVKLARHVGGEVLAPLYPTPVLRVLEGIAPKNPKKSNERTAVLRSLLEDAPQLTSHLNDQADAELLRRVYYFIACDPMLRDYLMWPLYNIDPAIVDDPMSAYFELWRHGVKYRSYKEGQLDLYLPVHRSGPAT